jgi:hypothetical protein
MRDQSKWQRKPLYLVQHGAVQAAGLDHDDKDKSWRGNDNSGVFSSVLNPPVPQRPSYDDDTDLNLTGEAGIWYLCMKILRPTSNARLRQFTGSRVSGSHLRKQVKPLRLDDHRRQQISNLSQLRRHFEPYNQIHSLEDVRTDVLSWSACITNGSTIRAALVKRSN